MATAADVQAKGEERAFAYWRSIPDRVTVEDALAMPWGGERNLVLRKALGIKFPSKTVCMVNQGDVIQIVTSERRKADYYADTLRGALEGWTVKVTKRPDKQLLVTGYR